MNVNFNRNTDKRTLTFILFIKTMFCSFVLDNAFQCTDKDGMDLLLHWHRRFDFFFNFCHLQELLTKCKADELVRDCEKFAEEHLSSMKMFYFSRKFKGKGISKHPYVLKSLQIF